MNITTASKAFADSLYKVFRDWTLNTELTSHNSKNKNVYYRIWVKGKDDIKLLATILYTKETKLFNDKKKRRLEKWSEKHVD